MAGSIIQYRSGDGVTVTRLQAMGHVDAEYHRWQARAINARSAVQRHFPKATVKVQKLAADNSTKGKGGAA